MACTRSAILPSPRRGLSRDEAALYVGVGCTKFDELVKADRMPKPFRIDGRVLWDILDLDEAINRLKEVVAGNPWDRIG